MAKIARVQLPDGRTAKFEVADDATPEEVTAATDEFLKTSQPGKKYAPSQFGGEITAPPASPAPASSGGDKVAPYGLSNLITGGKSSRFDLAPQEPVGLKDVIAHSMTFGLTDEASGVGDAIGNVIRAPFSGKVDFDPIGAYSEGRQAYSDAIGAYEAANPVKSIFGNVLGAIGSVPGKVATSITRAPNLLGKMWQSAKVAAPFGAAQGFGNSTGYGRIPGALGGGMLAAGLGAAMPVAGAILSPTISGVRRLLTGGEGLAAQRISEAMAADNLTPSAAGAAMDAARSRGVPAVLADQGENLRRLAGAVTRQPGDARALMTQALTERMTGQNDRITNAIGRDLGPIANVSDASAELARKAKAAAKPLYDKAYAAPVISTPEIAALLQTPAGKIALGKAVTIAENKRIDPKALGFALDDQGNVVLNPTIEMGADEAGNLTLTQAAARQRGYTTRSLDLVKRGLDDVIEESRNPLTGKLELDAKGDSINTVKNQLLTEMDRLNPAYKEARKAYQGPAGERDALAKGRDMVGKTAEQLDQATRNLTETQRAQFDLGYRSGLATKLSKLVDAADRPRALIGAPERRAALQTVFGEQPGLPNFLDTLKDEAAGNLTHNVALRGSPTAVNLADDAMIDDRGIVDGAVGRFIRGSRGGGMTGGLTNILAPIFEAPKFGVGNMGQSVRQSLAALLSESDPAALTRALAELNTRNVRDAALRAKVGRLGIGSNIVGGSIAGRAAAQ